MARVRFGTSIKIIAALVVAAGLAYLGLRAVTGQYLGPRSSAHLILALLDSQRVRSYSRGQYTNIMFLHHSVGENLIAQGQVRQKLTAAGYTLWDQAYNWEQLIGPDGKATGYSYNVPNDNTDPDGLARIFAQALFPVPVNTFSALMQHEVIIFKSCFPVSDIATDELLAEYKTFYLGIREVLRKHPEKVFIVLTPPPLNPAETTAANAQRARAFANWLTSKEFLTQQPNVFAFDLFDAFAEANPAAPDYSMLRADYRNGADSHPNAKANETVAPALVDFVIQSIQTYRASNSLGTAR
jgi:hypothetical protein